ncbi:BRO family protein [Bacillus sp. FSL R12-0074]|uniref:BRO family protein n=1 Tax=Bacillus sp. FSL R12-0074 TaxID=2954664 RepID=UPI0030F6498F
MFDIIKSEFGDLRTQKVNGVEWFVASDICRMIDYKNPSDVFKKVDPKELKRVREATGNKLLIATSTGLEQFFETNKRSKKEDFKRVREWAFEANIIQNYERDEKVVNNVHTLGGCLLQMSLVNVKLLRLMVNYSFQLWR